MISQSDIQTDIQASRHTYLLTGRQANIVYTYIQSHIYKHTCMQVSIQAAIQASSYSGKQAGSHTGNLQATKQTYR